MESLVCFVCACLYTYVEELAVEGKSDIEWVQPFKPDSDSQELFFLNRPIDEAGELLNLNTFLHRYDKVSDAGHRLQDRENFSDWCLRWPSNDYPCGRKILCCPEDSRRFFSGLPLADTQQEVAINHSQNISQRPASKTYIA